MKIAGRKNDGAWFRTNKAISKLSDTESDNLRGSIAASAYIDAAYNAVTGLMAAVGIQGIAHAANVMEWAQSFMTDGIPRQIWNGKLSWDTYTKKDNGYFAKNRYTYEQDHAFQIREFGEDLRRICKRYFLARRQARDLFNSGGKSKGNPGGMPDAQKDSPHDLA